MNKTIQERVAGLSATLKPIKDYKECSYITGDMVMEAEDSNSYNASFYCDGWVKPCFEGDFMGAMLQKVEEYQVLRLYYICTRLEGLAYNEIPENWEEPDAPDFPEMEITDTIEFRQIWFNQTEQTTINLEEIINEDYNNEAFVVYIDSIQDWIFEPKHRQFILDKVNQHEEFEGESQISLAYFLSPCSELLSKYAPQFGRCVKRIYRTDDAIKYYNSLRIAIKHHYTLPTTEEETRMYLDYLKLAELAQLDLRNPKFVCPTDLQAEHDKLVARKDKLELEAELNKARKMQKEFEEQHSWLFGIEFDTDNFHFKSLDSVEAYCIEGHIMHHCVYRCGYYNEHNVLTMHVSDHEGNRVATCSIDLAKRAIIELQTICNNSTWRQGEEYKEIWNILMARMHTFPKKQRINKKLQKVA